MTAKDDVSEAAKALSKLGASKGGEARARLLSPAERKVQASLAARARWAKEGKTSKSIGPDEVYSMFPGTLPMGDISFECHVLNDGRRVLTQREVVRLVSGGRDSSNLQRYLSRNSLVPEGFLEGRIIQFRIPGLHQLAHGFEATLLLEICDYYIQAREDDLLKKSQIPLAVQASIIMRSCAKVGIIALIDEATGYQQVRERNALQLKLQAFIAEEMQEWVSMFPTEFWTELARLENIKYSARNRPLRWGKYVMAFVYDAIDEDVGRKLREINKNPHYKQNHHQWLQQFGKEKLNNQIQQVIAIMKLCDDMADFKRKFSKVFRKTPLQLEFTFDTDLSA